MTREMFDAACIARADIWLPANGGTEIPFFTREGVKLLYCYNPAEDRHAYIDMGRDMVLTDEEARMMLG